jgi:hypothetical protein
LIEAGIVRVPFGPSPLVTVEAPGRIRVDSTRLVRPSSVTLDRLIRGHLEPPTVHRSASPLLARLYARGRLRQFRVEGVEVGSVDLSTDLHPIDAAGNEDRRIWILGPLNEGITYFNHYLPSPKSRVRAFVDADACVRELLETATEPSAVHAGVAGAER